MGWRTKGQVGSIAGMWYPGCPAALLTARRGYYYPFFYAYFAAYLSCSTPRLNPMST